MLHFDVVFLQFTVDEDIPDKVDIDVNDDAEEEQVKLPKLDLIMYTADELIELRTAVMSQTWPSYLDEAFKNNRGSWDPDRWHQNKKRGSTPPPSEGDKISEKGDRTKKDETNEAGINKVGQLTDIVNLKVINLLNFQFIFRRNIGLVFQRLT